MADPTRPAQTDEALLRLARNGAEPPPHYVRWVCNGVQATGRPCGKILMEMADVHGRIRVICPKCSTLHEWTGGN